MTEIWEKPVVREVELEPYVTCQKCRAKALAGLTLEDLAALVSKASKKKKS